MGTKVNSNYEDLITFTRASAGHALRPVSYGTELVSNGTFDTDSDWTKLSGSTISGGKGHIVSTGSFVSLAQNIGAVTGKIYFVTIDVTVNSGAGVYIGIGGGTTDSRRFEAPTTGSYAVAVVAGPTDTGVQITRRAATDTDVDNISVKEVTFDVGNNLVLFEHPDGIPRVEWDSAGNRLGLLVEEARTNLVPYSDFSSDWNEVRSTLTANQAVSPDGTQIAVEIVEDALTDPHYINDVITATASAQHTLSVYVKQGSGNRSALLRTSNEGSDDYIIFDFATETITETGSGTSNATSQSVGNGWYRIAFTYTQSGDTSSGILIGLSNSTTPSNSLPSYTGDGTSSIYVYGAQFEQGSFPTSYIKSNSGSTTSRSADVASIPVADFGYNNSNECTLFCHISGMSYEDGGTGYPIVTRLDNASNANDRRGFFVSESSESLRSEVVFGGSGQAGLTVTTSSGGSFGDVKMAFAMAENDFAVSGNGGAVETDTSGTVASSLPINKLVIALSSASLNGHIKSIQYYPRRLTNAQLQALTEPRSTPTLSLTFDGQESSYKENYIHG